MESINIEESSYTALATNRKWNTETLLNRAYAKAKAKKDVNLTTIA